MADEQFALSPSVTPPPTEADYEAIFAAVMETMRGRWFLSEYAKRNRHADTDAILAALARVEAAMRAAPPAAPASPAERVRIDLVEMAKAIEHTRAEIASIKPEGDRGSLSEATEELDSIVHTTERATSDILAAAEQVQEIAWTLREHGTDGDSCDALDRRAADIYTACSFQDLTGQRTRKVVDVLSFLEARIKSMIEIWGGAVSTADAPINGTVAPQIHDAPDAEHLDQPHIDEMMPGAQVPRPAGEEAPGDAPDRAAGPVVALADDTRAEPGAPEPADAESAEFVVEHVEPEHVEPEHAEPEHAEPEHAEPEHIEPERTEPEHVEPERTESERTEPERAEPARAEPEHVEPERAEDAEVPEPEHAAPDHPDRTELAPDEPEPGHLEPARAGAEPNESPEPHIADPEIVEAAAPAAPDDAPAPPVPPVIVPALAAVGATVFELSPPEIGPVSAAAPAVPPEPEPEPETPRTDPVAILERILAIIHEPPEAPAETTIAAPAPAEQDRAALMPPIHAALMPPIHAALMPSNDIAPVRLGGAPAVGAVTRPDFGVPGPDYSFASDFDVAAPAASAARPAAPPAGIADLPYAHYSEPRPLTVASAIDDMLLEMPLRADLSRPAVSAPPVVEAAPIEPPVAKPTAPPTPLAMPEPAALARQAVTPVAKSEPIKSEPVKPEPIAKAAPSPEPAPKPAPEPALKPVAVAESDTELEWAAEFEPEPVIASEPVSEAAPKPAEEPAEVATLPVRPAPTAEPPATTPAPAVVPAAETSAPVRVSPVKPAALATPPEPAAPAVHRVAASAAKPRHPGLAAIAALSDDEKIALFS